MCKYYILWKHIKKNSEQSFKLSFDEIKYIAGIEIDHSFLNNKKELLEYGYKLKKKSFKDKTVIFQKIN